MTSNDAAQSLLRRVCFLEDDGPLGSVTAAYTFERDFDSPWTWPDLPFDTGVAASRYPLDSRSDIDAIIDRAGTTVGTRAPAALRFVNDELERVLLRRSDAVAGASSSSNRAHIGASVWTNLERAPECIHACIEGLVHEAVHQYLYRAERDGGNLCDLDDARRFRSPWSGNRIPLHSLVHAGLVWFSLLTLWCQLARTPVDESERHLFGERVARILFGFTFLEQVFDDRSFPTHGVDPRIGSLLRQIARSCSVVRPANQALTVRHLFQLIETGHWVGPLSARIGELR